MNNKIIAYLLSYILAFSFNSAIAQRELPFLSIKNIDYLKIYINKFYKPNEKFVGTACINSVIYVKIKIDKNSSIASVDVSETGPVEIKEALKKAIWATNDYWKLTTDEKKEIENKVFILPFIFCYQSGCSPGGIITNEDTLKVYRERQKNLNDGMLKSVNNMLRFESSSYGSINCILISPMFVGSIN
ncbi:MAG: hypothetical protein JWR12_504 [Mucilaginibacter sp.]|nr:hypothetical protein [Mucilaginibacter sp.]